MYREVDEVLFRALTRRRWQYYGAFTDVDGTVIMAMTPLHQVWNFIQVPNWHLKYLTHPVF